MFILLVAPGIYEYLTKRDTGCDVDVSRLFIYYNARVHQNDDGALDDSGCSMTSGIQALEEHGVCLESIWPYETKKVNRRPEDEAYRSAQAYRITEALQIDIDLNQIQSCLAQGFPFVFGLKLFTSFDRAAKSGVVPLPDASETSRESHGRSASQRTTHSSVRSFGAFALVTLFSLLATAINRMRSSFAILGENFG